MKRITIAENPRLMVLGNELCGCSMLQMPAGSPFIAFCNKHSAAPQLLALVKQYRQEAIDRGADVSDVQEIDKVLRMAGEDI